MGLVGICSFASSFRCDKFYYTLSRLNFEYPFVLPSLNTSNPSYENFNSHLTLIILFEHFQKLDLTKCLDGLRTLWSYYVLHNTNYLVSLVLYWAPCVRLETSLRLYGDPKKRDLMTYYGIRTRIFSYPHYSFPKR